MGAWALGPACSVIAMGESSDIAQTGVGSGSPELLYAILNLSRFHREHEKFYASAPRQQAVILQRHGRTLCALADRWDTVAPSVRAAFSPFEGAEDLNDPAALQLDGVLFMEGEGEPAEITRIKRDVQAIGDEASATGSWLAGAMTASWDMAASLGDVPQLAGLLGDRHRIIANDWQAAEMSALAGRILHRAAGAARENRLHPVRPSPRPRVSARLAPPPSLRVRADRPRGRPVERLGRARARQRAALAAVPGPGGRRRTRAGQQPRLGRLACRSAVERKERR